MGLSLVLLVSVVAATPYNPYYHPSLPYAGYGHGLQARAGPNVDEATARYLINFGVFQMVTGTFTSQGSSGVTGMVRFFQNPFITDSKSKYSVEIKGMKSGTSYYVSLSDSATTVLDSGAPSPHDIGSTQGLFHTGEAPSFQLFDRFTVKGIYSEANIDGAGTSKKLLKNFYVQVWEGSSTLSTFAKATASTETPVCATSSKLA